MANRSRDKGTKAESDFVQWMQAQGERQVERHALHGRRDVGDINGIPGLVVSVKTRSQGRPACGCTTAPALNFSGWLRDLRVMQANVTRWHDAEPAPPGLLVVRRTGSPNVGDWYAVQTMSDWWGLYKELLT